MCGVSNDDNGLVLKYQLALYCTIWIVKLRELDSWEELNSTELNNWNERYLKILKGALEVEEEEL
jgi:hypothetical protein